MMRLTPSKLLFNIKDVFPEVDKAKRINKGNTSIIYEYKNKFYIFTIESIKAEWLYHIKLITNYKYVGDARYSGYSSGDGEYKTFIVPVTFYVIRKLKQIRTKENKEKVTKYIYELEDVANDYSNRKNRNEYTNFWWYCLTNAKSRIIKKIANFILDYETSDSEYSCDAFSFDQWVCDSKGVYCIDPFHKRELSKLLWLSKRK